MTRFYPGEIKITVGAVEQCAASNVHPLTLLRRHLACDWGDLCTEDWCANEVALLRGQRLLSSYVLDGVKIWIITEWDRSLTTILLAQEY